MSTIKIYLSKRKYFTFIGHFIPPRRQKWAEEQTKQPRMEKEKPNFRKSTLQRATSKDENDEETHKRATQNASRPRSWYIPIPILAEPESRSHKLLHFIPFPSCCWLTHPQPTHTQTREKLFPPLWDVNVIYNTLFSYQSFSSAFSEGWSWRCGRCGVSLSMDFPLSCKRMLNSLAHVVLLLNVYDHLKSFFLLLFRGASGAGRKTRPMLSGAKKGWNETRDEAVAKGKRPTMEAGIAHGCAFYIFMMLFFLFVVVSSSFNCRHAPLPFDRFLSLASASSSNCQFLLN